MDKFEKIIKQAVEGYEAPYNPQAWDNVSNELGDSFEQLMKDSTSGYEAPYNPAAWEAVSSQLGPTYSAWKWIGGSAAVIAIIAGSSYFIDTNEVDDNQLTNHQSKEVTVHTNDNTSDVSNTYTAEEFDHNNTIVTSDENSENNTDLNNEDNTVIHSIDPDLNNDQITGITNEDDIVVVQDNGTVNNDGTDETVQNNGENTIDYNENDATISNNTTQAFKASAKFNMSVSEICQNGKCEFTPKRVNDKLNYYWNFGDGAASDLIEPSHKFSKAGEFTITLQVKDPRTNKLLDSHSEVITVHALPNVDFSWTQSAEAIPTYTFANDSYNSSVLMWNIKGLKQSTNNQFEYTFRKAGNYEVELTAKNEFGCTNTAVRKIEVEEDYNLLAPTAFSPNGDGNYDKFIPLALTVLDVDFTMTIFDKSGKQVYWTQNAYEPWDGKFTEDNVLAPNESSYIWRVELINSNGEKEFYQGQVFVVY